MHADRIKVTTSTTGTGALTLASTGVRNATYGDFLAPAEVPTLASQPVTYFITSGNNFAQGIGVLSSDGLTLTRDANEVRWNGSTYATGLLSLSGTSTVMLTPCADDMHAASIGQDLALRIGMILN